MMGGQQGYLLGAMHYQMRLNADKGMADAKKFAGILGAVNGQALLAAGAVGAIGLVGGAVLAKGISAAVKYEKAWAEVRTILTATEAEAAVLGDRVSALSTMIPENAEGLAKGFYQTISSGITDTSDALEVLDVASRAATAGLTSTFTSVDVITTILNAYGKAADQAERVSDILFTTVREGKIVFDDLARNIGIAIPFFAAAGVEVEDLAAAMATLTKGGLPAAIATTALRATINQVLKPSDDAVKLAHALGIEFDKEAIAARGLVGWLEHVNEKTQGSATVLAKLFPNVRGLAAVFALTGRQSKEFARIQDVIVNKSTGNMDSAFRKMSDTVEVQADLVKNKLSKYWRDFGNNFLKLVGDVVRGVSSFSQSNEELAASAFDASMRLKDAKETLPELLDRYKELMPTVSGNVREHEELSEIIDTVANAFPGLIQAVNEYGEVIALNTERVNDMNFALEQQALKENKKLLDGLLSTYGKNAEKVKKYRDEIVSLNDAVIITNDRKVVRDVSAMQDVSANATRLRNEANAAYVLGTTATEAMAKIQIGSEVLAATYAKSMEEAQAKAEMVREKMLNDAQFEVELASKNMEQQVSILAQQIGRVGLGDAFREMFNLEGLGVLSEEQTARLQDIRVELFSLLPGLFERSQDGAIQYTDLLDAVIKKLADVKTEADKVNEDAAGADPFKAIKDRWQAFKDEQFKDESEQLKALIRKALGDLSDEQLNFLMTEDDVNTYFSSILEGQERAHKAAMEQKKREAKAFNEALGTEGVDSNTILGAFLTGRARIVGAQFNQFIRGIEAKYGKLGETTKQQLFLIANGIQDFNGQLGDVPEKAKSAVAQFVMRAFVEGVIDLDEDQLSLLRKMLGGKDAGKNGLKTDARDAARAVQATTDAFRDLNELLGGRLDKSFSGFLNGVQAYTVLMDALAAKDAVGIIQGIGAMIGSMFEMWSNGSQQAAKEAKFFNDTLKNMANNLAEFTGAAQQASSPELRNRLSAAKRAQKLLSDVGGSFWDVQSRIKNKEAQLAWVRFKVTLKELGFAAGAFPKSAGGMKRAMREVFEVLQDEIWNFGKIDASRMGGAMERWRLEMELFDITDPIEQLQRMLAIFYEYTGIDLSNLSKADLNRATELITGFISGIFDAPEQLTGDFATDALLNGLNQFTDQAQWQELADILGLTTDELFDFIEQIKAGNFTEEELLAFLADLEGVLDEAGTQGNQPDSVSVGRSVSITEQQGDTMVALLSSLKSLQENFNSMFEAFFERFRFAFPRPAPPAQVNTTITVEAPVITITGSDAASGSRASKAFVEDLTERLRPLGARI